MIELPEATVIVQQINSILPGKTILRATANLTPHAFARYTGDPAEYNSLLAGKTIQGATTIGDHIEVRADNMLLHFSTSLRFYGEDEQRAKKHQLLLEFRDGTAMSASVQMWGCLQCFERGSANVPHCALVLQPPSPLSEGFTREFFDSLFTEKTGKMSAKAFLATEQRIPGLGNGVLQDILWTARIHPKKKMSSLSSEEVGKLYDAVKLVLKEMTTKGGRDTERDLIGRAGGYKTILSKLTVDTPCPECGTYISKEAYLGGSIYFCGGCQQL